MREILSEKLKKENYKKIIEMQKGELFVELDK